MKAPWRGLVPTCALLLLGCPLGPFPGGTLRGEVARGDVSDWSFVSKEETCQLETNPDDPHSVNTWCAGWGDALYVPTSMVRGPSVPSEREWVRNVQTETAVRLRARGVVYELEAVQVTDDVEYDTVLRALEEKYGLDPDARDPDREIWIYRLQPR